MDLKLIEEPSQSSVVSNVTSCRRSVPCAGLQATVLVLVPFSIINDMDSGTEGSTSQFSGGVEREQGLIHHWKVLPSHRHFELEQGAERSLREFSRGETNAVTSPHGGKKAAREGCGCSGEQKLDCEPGLCLCSRNDGQLHIGPW